MSSSKNATKKPVILAIETSGKCGSVALVAPGHLIAEYSITSKATHSVWILSGVDLIMKEAGISWPELDAIAVSLGPGSFTGLRIGLSTAKGLVMASGKKMIGVPTLDMLACQLPYTPQLICPIIDARKKEIYTAFYQYSSPGTIQRLSDYRAVRPEDLPGEIKEPAVFVGDGLTLYENLLKKQLGELALPAPLEIFYARAAVVGKIALGLWEKQEFLDPSSSSPIYIRKSDAELNLGKPSS